MTVIMGAELNAMAAANAAAIGMPMANIPGRTFMMGSQEGAACEMPVHPVNVDTFQMGMNLVTNEEYRRFVGSLGSKRFVKIGLDIRTRLEGVLALGDDEGEIERLTAERFLHDAGVNLQASGYRVYASVLRTARIEDYIPRSGFDGSRQPVIDVSWYEALAFANLCGMRLPTEAEWELAARVRPDGGLREYATPNDDAEQAHYKRDAATTSTVDVDDLRYPSLPNGLRHMSGNVCEWVHDWFGQYLERQVSNPFGPLHGEHKVVRGGSWIHSPRYLRAACRSAGDPNVRGHYLGFRCASSLRTPGLT